jgi:mRNA-degrading endonuclease toxin of MazEF toxin-antitoxin module
LSTDYWAPWPAPGDIVDCLFPEEVGTPGPKERPALVLQVEQATDDARGCVVVVAYATSQKTTRVYAGEFVIAASTITGLTKDTKFDLVNRHALAWCRCGTSGSGGG